MTKFLFLVFLVMPVFLHANPFVDAVSGTVRLMGEDASGTGFLIEVDEGEFVLATAAHVFSDMKGESCQVIFRRSNDAGGYDRDPVDLTIRKGEKPLWRKHETLDIGLMPIDLPEGSAVKPFSLSQIAKEDVAKKGTIEVGDEVCIPCFPVGTESNKAGWPVLRRGTIATHPLTPLAEAETFFVDSSSFGGESGAPVVAWKGDAVFVIGVISSMQRQTEKSKTQLEEKTTHLPLGLGIAVQSPFLRELIDE